MTVFRGVKCGNARGSTRIFKFTFILISTPLLFEIIYQWIQNHCKIEIKYHEQEISRHMRKVQEKRVRHGF